MKYCKCLFCTTTFILNVDVKSIELSLKKVFALPFSPGQPKSLLSPYPQTRAGTFQSIFPWTLAFNESFVLPLRIPNTKAADCCSFGLVKVTSALNVKLVCPCTVANLRKLSPPLFSITTLGILDSRLKTFCVCVLFALFSWAFSTIGVYTIIPFNNMEADMAPCKAFFNISSLL